MTGTYFCRAPGPGRLLNNILHHFDPCALVIRSKKNRKSKHTLPYTGLVLWMMRQNARLDSYGIPITNSTKRRVNIQWCHDVCVGIYVVQANCFAY